MRPTTCLRYVISAILLFAYPVGVFSASQANDGDSVRSLVGKLLELYQQKDIDQLISHWSETSPFLTENKKALRGEFAAFEKIIVNDFEIREMKIDGDRASLRIVAEMALTRAKMEQAKARVEKKNRSIELVKENGIWKVWKFVVSEEELAAAIIGAQTEEEREALMEKKPELITPDLAVALAQISSTDIVYKKGYQHALAIYQLAYKLAEESGDQFAMANALLSAGYIYGMLGTPERSPELGLEYYGKSLKIGEEFEFKEIIAKSLIRSAVIYSVVLGEFSRAEEYYQNGLKLAEELGDDGLTFLPMNNLGVIYRERGNYVKALELWLKCLKLTEGRLDSGADWYRMARTLENIGATFRVQRNSEQCLAYSQRAIVAAKKAISLGDPTAKLVIGNAYCSIGDVYLDQGNESLAMDYYQQALKLGDEFVNPLLSIKDRFIFTVKIRIGDALALKKDTQQAVTTFQEALSLAEKARDKTQMAYPLLSLSEIYLSLNDYREALAFANRALREAEQIGFNTTIHPALLVAAKAQRKLGNSEEARLALSRAIDTIEQLHDQSARGELDRQRSFENSITPYQAMIDLQVDQKQFIDAFAYAERAKGRTLLELLQNGRVKIEKSTSSAEREQEQQLNRQLVSLNRQITDEKVKSHPDDKRLAAIEEQLKKARLEFEAFQSNLYASHPELKVHRGEIRPISIDDVSDLIPDAETALLDFIITEENVHLFVLTKGSSNQPVLNVYTTRIESKQLAEKVERFRQRMENRDYDFQSLSRELYGLLLEPAQKQLQKKTNLIISPDNVLWDLPFQALLSPERRFLIEDAAISYAPSLSVLREMQLAGRKRAPARASLLALGNPALGARSRELAKFAKMDAELQLLPEAAAQVRALGRLYGPSNSDVYTDSAAREELLKEQSARYRILHLATHGILNDASPMYSNVILSQTSGNSEEDGLLEAWEMMNLDLNADLVVLSACETARGRVGAGEGVIGMTWALFVAGCPRTVVSQWKVEAASTTALMLEFHKRFKTRYDETKAAVSTAEAMRQAALKVMRNPGYKHPFYWGGFVVVGDGN